LAWTQFEMAMAQTGQLGVVTVASSQGRRQEPWKRCVHGMSCVSTAAKAQNEQRRARATCTASGRSSSHACDELDTSSPYAPTRRRFWRGRGRQDGAGAHRPTA